MSSRVTVIIPYHPDHTPSSMVAEAKESVESQSVETEIITIKDRHRGPAAARNVGIEKSSHRYVAFLDADDLWKEDKLERQIERLNKTGAGLCVEGSEMSTDKFIKGLIVGDIETLTSSILIDKEKVDSRFSTDLERREDHLFMIEAASMAGVCFCNDIFQSRKHSQGLSANTDPEQYRENSIKFFDKCRNIVEISPEIERKFQSDLYFKLGRLNHKSGNYQQTLPYFVESMRNEPDLVTIAALAISFPYFVLEKI